MSDSVTFNIAFREKERIHSFPVTVPRQYNTRLDGYNLYSAVIQVAHYLQSNQLLDFNEVRNLVYKIIAHDWSSQQAAFDDILHWPASRINTFDDQIIPKDPPSVQGTNAYRVHLLVMWERTFDELLLREESQQAAFNHFVENVRIKVTTFRAWNEADLLLNEVPITQELPTVDCFTPYLQRLERKRVVEHNSLLQRELTNFNAHFTIGEPEVFQAEESAYVFVKEIARDSERFGMTSSSYERESLLFSYAHFALKGKVLGSMTYKHGVSWTPAFVVQNQEGVSCRYSSRNSLSLTHQDFGPLLLVEVQSTKDRSDCWRMLLLAQAACRYSDSLCKPSCEPIVICLYLDEDLRLSFYFVHFDKRRSSEDRKLIIYQPRETKSLLGVDDGLYVAWFFNNLRDQAHNHHEKFDRNLKLEYVNMDERLRWKFSDSLLDKPNERTVRKTIEESLEPGEIPQETCKAFVLLCPQYHKFVISEHKDVFYTTDIQTSKQVAVKRLRSRKELDIFNLLPTKEANHIIPILSIFNGEKPNPIIIMPRYSPIMYIQRYESKCPLYAEQLVDAVSFLHEHLICHLDIKPPNVVIDRPGRNLHLIDFDIAIRISSAKAEIRGARGTPDWAAPELQLTTLPLRGGFAIRPSEVVADQNLVFSPVLADIWAVGNVIQFLASFLLTNASDLLYHIGEALSMDKPSKRISLVEAKRRLITMNSPLAVPTNSPETELIP